MKIHYENDKGWDLCCLGASLKPGYPKLTKDKSKVTCKKCLKLLSCTTS